MTRWPGIALLLLASTLPSLFALDSPWLWDDVAIVRDATSFDELRELPRAWTSELWTDRRPGPPLYRPVPRMLWTLQTIAGDGDPLVFRAVSIALYGLVTVLLFFYLRQHFPRRVAFTASLLFALFPIHTEVVVLAVGQAELLAAAFGIAALLMWKRRQNAVALTLFALAVLSKESAAAIAILGWLEAPRPRKRALTAGVIAVAIVGAATWIRLAVDSGPTVIPALDNPASLVSHVPRALTALWIQCLYVTKTLFPWHLAADYSYPQIPLVMSFGDPRAWAGVSLLVASGIAISKRVRGWQGILAWWILFLPAANLFFPIGTLMGERLAFLPSAGLAAFVAAGMASMGRRTLTVVLVVIAAAFSTVSAVRYRTCSTPQRFYEGLVRDAPENAKAWSSLGLWLASENRLGEAVTAYDRSIELYPFDGAARFNRANALVRLGRLDEAAAEYRNVVRLNPGRTRAESILRKLGYR